jgi:2-polyprenyl-3-methyl-5-hydroxy-6-metoxy-1,4-benzoquinol methylase
LNCPLCIKPLISFYHKKTNITYYFCKPCEYIFKDSTYHQSLEKQKERYSLHQNNEDSEGYRDYFKRFLDFTLPLVFDVKTALDFGCGRTSLLASMLEEKSISCEYYDPIYHPSTLDKNKKYSLIVSTEVFEHLHQPKEVFKYLIDKLDEGGYLAIQTEFHPNNIEDFKKWYYPQDPTHIVFFTQKSFQILASMYSSVVVSDNGKNMVLIQKRL